MHRVLALIYAVPGIGWAVATLAVLLYHRVQGELPMTPFAGGSWAAHTLRSGPTD